MPPRIDGPRPYLVRNQLLAAALSRGIPNLTELAQRVDVTRPQFSVYANGHQPISESLEAALRVALGASPRGRVAWITKR